MKYTKELKRFIRNNQDNLIDLMDVWIEDYKEKLIWEDDEEKKKQYQMFIRQFESFKKIALIVGQRPKEQKESQI